MMRSTVTPAMRAAPAQNACLVSQYTRSMQDADDCSRPASGPVTADLLEGSTIV